MCATLHNNTVVRKGRTVACTRAIPLIVKKDIIEEAIRIANSVKESKYQSIKDSDALTLGHSDTHLHGIIEVKEMRRPRAGVVITGNEVYYGRIKDAFAPVIADKIQRAGGEIVGVYYAPDDESFIESRLRELIAAGADLLITTGGMSVDPDDVTRFAIRKLGASDITYGSSALPGAMFLVAYLEDSNKFEDRASEESLLVTRHSSLVTILGIPSCGMYAKATVFDLVLPRILAGEKVGRRELAELGHGGLCMKCETCNYPVCPFGKQ